MNPLAAAIGRHYGWSALALVPGLALAGPSGEQVVAGTVGVARPDANTTTVTQGSSSAVVNWHSFSVDGQEYVQFVQPGAQAAILNRVTGGNASQILGRIEANGRVFLVNPQGVYFGAGAKVDTSGFAASTLDIANDDFMRGRYVFAKGTGAPDAAVTNAGQVKGDQFVVLMGDRVGNEGLVQARLGSVVLGAGEKVTLQLDDTGLVSYAVDEATAAAQAGVENTGEIVANGGRVLMTAKVANDLVATAVNNAGVVRATGIAEDGGEIFLRGSGGKIVNSGTLDASGANGGRVVVSSATDDVEIAAGAVITAAGAGAGDGGTVRLVAEQTLDVAAGAMVDARGGTDGGAGGFVEVSAHAGALQLDGEIEAGAGGEILIDPLRLGIGPGASAPGGNSTLATVGKGFIESKLNSNTDVTLVAENEIFATGGPFTITATGTGHLALRIGQISGTGSASLGVGLSTGSFGFSTDPAGDINLAGIAINIQGLFTASAGSSAGNVTLGAIGASGVTLNGTNSGLTNGNVVTGAISAPGGVVQIEAGATAGNISTGPINALALAVNTLNGNGVNTGNVNITGISATQSARVRAGNTSGNLNVGAVSIAATTLDADLELDAVGGNVTVSGPLSVTTSGGPGADAFASLGGKIVNVGGNITVSAGAGGSSAELAIDAQNGINLNGNVTVSGAGESASVFLDNSGAGNINVNGNVTVNAGSFGSISFETNNGNINVNGNLSVAADSAYVNLGAVNGRINLAGGARATAQASYGSAEVLLQATRGVLVTGVLEAQAPGPANVGVFNTFYGGSSGDIVLQNVVSAASKSDVAGVRIINPIGAVRVNGTDSVRGLAGGRSASQLTIMAGRGGIGTGPSGLLDAPVVSLSSLLGGAIDVRTKSPDIAIANYGGSSPDVSIDNTAHAGPTVLRSSIVNYGDGSYGSSFAQNSFGGFGAFRLNAAGDVGIVGSMLAQNALINVSGGALAIKGTMIVGERNLPDALGDRLSLLFLSRASRADGGRIPLPRYNGAVTTGPNAIFRAQNGIELAGGLVMLDPDTPYVIFATDGYLELGPGVFSESSIGNEFLAQFTAFSPKAKIHVEDALPPVLFGDGPVFTNRDHFSKLPGTTMILGNLGPSFASPHVGGISVGQNGKIDIGHQNILFSTLGGTVGAGNIVSTGFIGEFLTAIEFERRQLIDPNPEPKQEREDKKKNKDYSENAEGSDDTGEQLVAQKSNNGQMCE